MANRQTKSHHKVGKSIVKARGAGNVTPTIKDFPIWTQPSRRKSAWRGAKPKNNS